MFSTRSMGAWAAFGLSLALLISTNTAQAACERDGHDACYHFEAGTPSDGAVVLNCLARHKVRDPGDESMQCCFKNEIDRDVLFFFYEGRCEENSATYMDGSRAPVPVLYVPGGGGLPETFTSPSPE